MENSLSMLVAGALSTGYAVAGLFFARFWRDTRDRLFAFFAFAFGLLALQRVALALVADAADFRMALYAIRLGAFLLILYAIVDKNRHPEPAA